MALKIEIPASGWTTDGSGSLVLKNFTFRNGAWTSRIGAEPFPVDNLGFPIDGLWVLPSGIYFSAAGVLRKIQDEAQQSSYFTLRDDLSNAPQGVLEVPGAVLAWGGDSTPVRIDTPHLGWGYGAAAAASAPDRVQPLYLPTPAPPTVLGVRAENGSASLSASADSINLWHPSKTGAISYPGAYGLGYAAGGTDGKSAAFDYCTSYVAVDGSEGPISARGTVDWEIPALKSGFRYCVGIETPPFPANVIAQKWYRTGNYAPDAPFDGDKTLRLIGISYSPTDTHWVDTTRGDFVGPELIAKAAPPMGRPAAMTVSGGRVWTARDSLVAYTDAGFSAQFQPQNYVPLPPTLGSAIALADLDGFPLVMGTRGCAVLSDAAGQLTAIGIVAESLVSAWAWCYHLGGVAMATESRIVLLSGNPQSGFSLKELSLPIRSAWESVSKNGPVYMASARGILYVTIPDGTIWLYHGETIGWSQVTGMDAGPIAADLDGDVLFGTRNGWGLWCLSAGRVSPGAQPVQDDPYVPGPGLTSEWRSRWQAPAGVDGVLSINSAFLIAAPTGRIPDDQTRWESGLTATGRPPVGGWPILAQGATIIEGSTEVDAIWGTAVDGLDFWPIVPMPPVLVQSAGLSRAAPAISLYATSTSDVVLYGAQALAQPAGRPR